ncbi:MAG: dihydrodipicolinate synthase family protein [Anderseniella sp.]
MTEKLTEDARGVYIISATPFTDTGELDIASADSLVEFYLEKGVTGMTILGMMGEAPKLAPDESVTFLEHMLNRVNGRVPVIVGVSSPGLDNMARLCNAAMEAGAGGVMIAPASGLTTEDKLYSYFAQVFEKLGPDIPVCYQDFPMTTGVNISTQLFNKLVADFPQLVMLKHEDWPGLNKLSAVRKLETETGSRRVSILTGNGGLFLPMELERGVDGAMTGFAYPEMLVSVVDLYRNGDRQKANDIFDAYLPLVRHEQQLGAGLAVRKEILRRRGAIANAATRAPGPRLSQTDHDDISFLTTRLERRIEELSNGS